MEVNKQPMPQDANHSAASEPAASSALTVYAGDRVTETAALPAAQTSAPETSIAAVPAPSSQADAGAMIRRLDSAAMEVSATQLVDEVFEDIDGLLDSPSHRAPYAPGGTSFTTNVFIPPAARTTDSSPALSSMVMLWGLFPAIVGGLCLGLALAFGIAGSNRQVAVPSAADNQPINADVDPETGAFLAYLDQSLERIERQVPEAESPAPTVPTIPEFAKSSTALPTATPFAGTPPRLLAPPVNVPVASLPTLPTVPVPPAPPRAPQPAPAAPTIPPSPVAVAPTAPSVTTPEPAPAAPSPVSPAAPEPIENISPSPHILVGLLQLGDRSAAIFEFDDGARRIRVGEAIGSSGWSLVSISQDEAVIRRNGDVRSIYIGQRI